MNVDSKKVSRFINLDKGEPQVSLDAHEMHDNEKSKLFCDVLSRKKNANHNQHISLLTTHQNADTLWLYGVSNRFQLSYVVFSYRLITFVVRCLFCMVMSLSWLSVNIRRIGHNSFSLFYLLTNMFYDFFSVCFCERKKERPWTKAIIIANEPFLVFLSVRSFFRSIAQVIFVLGIYLAKCVWFGLPCELFELQAICIEKLFRIITFFYDLFRLLVCVWTECLCEKRKK